jgi:hypothetical protein
MSVRAQIFVFVLFLVLGVSFLAHTILLVFEYWNTNWLDIVALSSFNYLFYPTLGIAVLCAIYLPACAFVDVYWRHVRFGRVALLGSLTVFAVLSYWMATRLAVGNHLSYMMTPEILQADNGTPPGCPESSDGCERLPILQIIANVRHVSQSRVGLGEFIHSCWSDPFIEVPSDGDKRRFCFAATPLPSSAGSRPQLLGSSECCRSQERLRQAIAAYLADPQHQSLTGRYYVPLETFKIFFLFLMVTASIFLVLRYSVFATYYKTMTSRIELGLVIAAIIVLMGQFMYSADMQAQDALYGTANRPASRGMAPFFTILYGASALLVALFIYARRGGQFGQLWMLAVCGTAIVALIQYDRIVAIIGRALGSGLSTTALVLLVIGGAVTAVVSLVVAVLPPRSFENGRASRSDLS